MNRLRSWSKSEKRMVAAVTLAAIVLAMAPNVATIYHRATGLPRQILPPDGVFCVGVAWSPDSKHVAALLNEKFRPANALAGSAGIWDVESLNLIKTVSLPDRAGSPTSPTPGRMFPFMGVGVTWLRDNSLVATGYISPTQQILPDATVSRPLAVKIPPTYRNQPATYFNHDAQKGIAVGSRLYHLTRKPNGWEAREVNAQPRSHELADILPDGERCVVVAQDPWPAGPINPTILFPPCSLELLDLRTSKVLWGKPEKEVMSLAIDPAGKIVFVVYSERKDEQGARLTLSSCVAAIRVSDGRELWRTKKEPNSVWDSLAVSPDNRLVAVRQFKDGFARVRLLNAEDGSVVAVMDSISKLAMMRKLRANSFSLGRQMAFSPDGRRLAMVVDRVFIWDLPDRNAN